MSYSTSAELYFSLANFFFFFANSLLLFCMHLSHLSSWVIRTSRTGLYLLLELSTCQEECSVSTRKEQTVLPLACSDSQSSGVSLCVHLGETQSVDHRGLD